MSPLTPEETVFRLLELGNAALLGMESEGRRVTVYLLDGDSERRVELTVHVNDLEPAGANLPVRPSPPADLSEADARERGLPLYLSREWMMRMLVLHKTLEAIAAESRYSFATLEDYRERHHIGDLLSETIRYKWDTGKYRTQKELADELGVSVGTVSNLVGKARDRQLAERIRELIHEGLPNGEIIGLIRSEGSSKPRDRLLRLIEVARKRDQ